MSGPDTQLFLRPGIIEFAWGHPDLALLPVAGLADAAALALRQAGPAAEAGGVSYVPGARFCSDGGGQDGLRLAFSLLSPTEMAEGARRLGAVIRAAVR